LTLCSWWYALTHFLHDFCNPSPVLLDLENMVTGSTRLHLTHFFSAVSMAGSPGT
jgi:hypothetical protein